MLKLIVFCLSLIIFSLPSAQARDRNLLEGNEAIYIYSNDGEKTFLGCLNCNTRASNSILNNASVFSSDMYPRSVFCRFGKFGSKDGEYSAANPEASNPPLLIGKDSGKVYGTLSLSEQGYQSNTAKLIYRLIRHGLEKSTPAPVQNNY